VSTSLSLLSARVHVQCCRVTEYDNVTCVMVADFTEDILFDQILDLGIWMLSSVYVKHNFQVSARNILSHNTFM